MSLSEVLGQADEASQEYLYLASNRMLWAKLGKTERDLKRLADLINHILDEFEIIVADLGWPACQIPITQGLLSDSVLGWDPLAHAIWYQSDTVEKVYVLETDRKTRVLAARHLRTLANVARGCDQPQEDERAADVEFYADLVFRISLSDDESLDMVQKRVAEVLQSTFGNQLTSVEVYTQDELPDEH